MSLNRHNRRDFLRFAAGTAASLPLSIQRALAIPAHSATKSIEDIGHVVIFMQENRSFDHYFGTMHGVRGFGDRNAVMIDAHRRVWQQRSRKTGSEILPFHLDTSRTRAQCIASLDHGWKSAHQAWNWGKYDDWVDAKTPLTMGYYKEVDIPFQFALADSFTICDAYFCSIMGPTDPNRICLWTGSIDPPGNQGAALIDNDLAEKGLASWTTYPERLEKAGISWRVYQQGTENDSKRPFEGNFGDNPLLFFTQYIHSSTDSNLRTHAMSSYTMADLSRDVKAGTLPQVSWVVAPEAYSEHPAWPPAYGAQYTAQVLDALTSNPDVWSKTVLILDYDENDGFFDHVVPPTPPRSPENGKSTVDTSHEFYNDPEHGPMPFGLGARVPMVIVSPWTRGGWVCSEVFDHTSVLRFLEARFGSVAHEPNVSAWRRTVCGDLKSAFDFEHPNASMPHLPDTRGYRKATDEACRVLPDAGVPGNQSLPRQEPGTRPSRALPYRLHADARVDSDRHVLWLDFTNEGDAGCVFHVVVPEHKDSPWVYTLGRAKELSDFWSLARGTMRSIVREDSTYSLYVYGPNGFVREIHGSAESGYQPIATHISYDLRGEAVRFRLHNPNPEGLNVTLRDNAYGSADQLVKVPRFETVSAHWPLPPHRWYDVTLVVPNEYGHVHRFSGRSENELPSISDPAQAVD